MLKVGSVYYISNGQLSGANRRYSTTGNDYRINFNAKTEVKAASDQARSRFTWNTIPTATKHLPCSGCTLIHTGSDVHHCGGFVDMLLPKCFRNTVLP